METQDSVEPHRRPTQILDGFVRLALRKGLAAASMRAVAEEAGVSLRLIQYYFGNKAELAKAALEHLERRSYRRWIERLAACDDNQSLARTLSALCVEALPDDDESRAFHRLWMSFTVEQSPTSDLSADIVREGPRRLEDRVAAMLAAGLEKRNLDPQMAARELLALVNGLSNGIMVGLYEPEVARAIVREHLVRLIRND